MTLEEMLRLVDGKYAERATFMPGHANRIPRGALGSAGFVVGVPRLGIPDLQETDAGLGVADPLDASGKPVRGTAGYSTALPAGLALASTWNPQLAYTAGAMIGSEARDEGFNVMLAGGVDLARDPRNGRNFEYAGEDPLLSGIIVGNQAAGIQSNHVISTLKHFAFNDQETNRGAVSAEISGAAARESDLLAFHIAIETGNPGAIMCSYNRINGVHACGDRALLDGVLKHDWRYSGFVMSDWGAVHSTGAALAGLDQESGDYLDDQIYFGATLKAEVESGRIPIARLRLMVHRILRSMFAVGLFDNPPVRKKIEARRDASVSLAAEEQGAVLLKNVGNALPLNRNVASIAVIGRHADIGVLSGGGSSQVWPVGGPAFLEDKPWPGPVIWDPSSPLLAIRKLAPRARLTFYGGPDPSIAATYAAKARVAIVFAYQWLAESIDAPNLSLPGDQDALIARVAEANRRTIVVLETGDPVTMPWLSQTSAVLAAWYPGQRGGEAIANLLFGVISPSGHLPLIFPRDVAQLPRATIRSDVSDYTIEGGDVGYRWFNVHDESPLFPFGYGLTYTAFRYSALRAIGGKTLRAEFNVTNTGSRKAADVAQLYVSLPPACGERARLLAGWQRIDLQPRETRRVDIRADPRIIARYDDRSHRWRTFSGTYTLWVAQSAQDSRHHANAVLRF